MGKGRWNGFGGNIEGNESIEEAAIRELQEEAGITMRTPVKHGILILTSELEYDIELHIFRANEFTGDPTESDEIKPQWFKHEDIPFHNMWSNDKYWLPLVLDNKKFKGSFVLNDNKIIDYKLEITEDLG